MPFLTAYDPPTLSDVPSFKLDGKLSIVFLLVLSGFLKNSSNILSSLFDFSVICLIFVLSLFWVVS